MKEKKQLTKEEVESLRKDFLDFTHDTHSEERKVMTKIAIVLILCWLGMAIGFYNSWHFLGIACTIIITSWFFHSSKKREENDIKRFNEIFDSINKEIDNAEPTPPSAILK